ncbi:MAG: SRPBCC family protein [Desulfuromonadales bacterium]
MLKKALLLAAVVLLCFGIMMAATRDASFAVEESRILEEPPRAIWSVLTDVNAWPEWWPGVRAAELDPAWSKGAMMALRLEGRPERVPAIVEIYRQGDCLSWGSAGVLGSTTRTIVRLEKKSNGILVSMENSLQGPQAFLARFTGKKAFSQYQKQVLQALQERLKARRPGAETEKGI